MLSFGNFGFLLQASSKKVITREEWEKKLSSVKIRKEDMNKLVMNFLVTEGYVEAAEKFQLESGTERILFFNLIIPFVDCLYIYLFFWLYPIVKNVLAIARWLHCRRISRFFYITWIFLLENSRYRSCNYH